MSSQEHPLLSSLLGFGFEASVCEQVLHNNPNGTLEQLVDQIIRAQEKQSSASDNKPTTTTTTATTSDSSNSNQHVQSLNHKYQEYLMKSFPTSKAYKMVFVVRNDLNMGKGKIAAQCCHAAVGLYRNILYENTSYFAQTQLLFSSSNSEPTQITNQDMQQWKQYLHDWEVTAEAKICLKADSDKELDNLFQKCLQQRLNCYLVVDAGRTQIEAGSKTVLGIGPAPVELIDTVTKHLKLL